MNGQWRFSRRKLNLRWTGNDTVDIEKVTKAIAAFEETLVTPNSRFDKYLKGDKKAITKDELAAWLVNLAWNGLSNLQKNPRLISVAKDAAVTDTGEDDPEGPGIERAKLG